jgi:hypothetical protein
MKANRRLYENKMGFAQLVPMVLAVVITFAVVFIGAYVNGEIDQSLEDAMPTAGSRSILQNNTLSTMDNVSGNWDSSLDIVQVVIIITLLASAIGAIFLFTRFR